VSATCVVCRSAVGRGATLCKACGRSYDRARQADDGTIAATIRWAARRAWRFARATPTDAGKRGM
jgi:hypothetical protein